MIMYHNCAALGPQTPGEQADCGPCRSKLEFDAFGSRLVAETIVRNARMRREVSAETSQLPPDHESEIEQATDPTGCHCSSCDPDTCAYCGSQDRRCTFCRHRPPAGQDGHA